MTNTQTNTLTQYKVPVAANRLSVILEDYTGRQADHVQWLYDLIIERKWTLKEAGKLIGRDGANLGKVLNGKYGGDFGGNLNAFVESIRTFREEWILTNGTTTPGFIKTDEAKKIFFACEKARITREVALVYGDLGSGKTTAGTEYCKQNPGNAHYFRFMSGEAYGSFLRSFGRSLGLPQRSVDALKEAIFIKLKRKKVDLIFIDEFHLPFTTTTERIALKCTEFIRDLRDTLDCGVVLCGTKVIPELLKTSYWSKALEQIVDRGNTIVNLKKRVSIKGLGGFFTYYSLPETPSQEAERLIKDILRGHSIRKLVFALRDGSRAASKLGQKYDWEHFVDAFVINASLNTKEE